MYNGDTSVLDALPRRIADIPRRWADAAPDAPAIHCGGRQRSYADLSEGIEAAREALAEAGVRPGDRVVLVVENCYAAVCFLYAATALDAWAVMANARLSEREIRVIVERSGARMTVYTTEESDAARKHAQTAGAAEHAHAAYGRVALGPVDLTAKPEPFHDDPAEQIAVVLYTSGTTGVPKGAMLSHRAMLYQSAIVSKRRGFAPGDCPYVVAPMVHVLGLAGMLLPLLYAGASVEFAARFEAGEVISALGQGHLTHLYGAPPMFAALVGRAAEQGGAMGGRIEAPRLKEILAGGAPLDLDLRQRVEKTFGMTLGHGYAATEFTPIAASTPAAPANEGAAGRPWEGIEVMLAGESGEGVPQGEVGEVWCRGPSAMSGYYRDPEATAEIMRPGGWVAIGDLAYIDEDGQIHVVGRIKDMIIRSGFNVYPAEVEGVLNTHAAVHQAAVVGRKVPDNEEVIAFVQPAPGAEIDIEELAAHAEERLAPYKKPARIIVLDTLPVGPTGKLSKTELREKARALD